MTSTRRNFLTLAGLAAGAGVGLGACSRGGGGGGGGGGAGAGSLSLTWWGNDVRNANTQASIDAYMASHEGVTIEPQPGEWGSYWDRLATQTAGNSSPDIIQMDMNYIAEYGQRGALLNLDEHGIDLSGFREGTADSGVIEGANYGANAGINTPVVLIRPEIFEELGVDVPDDTTWTWEDWSAVATAISDASDGEIIGTGAFYSNDAQLGGWLRQQGKALFVEGALGFDVADIEAWLEYHLALSEAGAIPTATQITEDSSVPLDQSAFATGRTAMAPVWSNQLQAFEAASGATMQILRYPSIDGDATTRQAWYKASMLWSVSARTADPEAAVEVINWWVNEQESAEIELAERGVPANESVADAIQPNLSDPQQRVAQFITDVLPELGETPIAPLAGGGNQLGSLLQRYGTDMLFGDLNPAQAAQGFHDELTASIQE